MRKRSTPQA